MRFYRKSKYSWRGMRGNEQMNHDNIREQIGHALGALADGDFVVMARDLLAVLGYESTRTLDISGRVNDFIAQFPAPNENTQTEQVFCENAQSVRILFQVTDTEIAAQNTLFDKDDFDTGNARSFLFAAIELNGKTYSRGQYAQFTREINKRIHTPTVVLFKTATDHLTLSFVHRREHKYDSNRDVLGHVSLIREIDPIKPHRAHLDILFDLSLPQRLQWMNAHDKPHNFDGLLAAWLNALDTEALNRRFYGDLFGWFERAIREAKFPSRQKRTLPPEEHIIRLITRLMFVWFIKEKRLIATDLFIEEQIARLLKNYDRDAGDSYYRAVLQNLFFATLNTEIDRRGFSQGSNATHRDFSRYRYENEIADPAQLLALFAQTPFINGGLFDCLDSEAGTRAGGYRIDCFTDTPGQRRDYSIPNRLFFDDDGLIPLFNRYKFTVEENTPVEQEVALDPELLGKVFENLLAAYNPETRDTARKQTGSYYTPRPVVDYMVDEALVATLAQACSPSAGDTGSWKARLRYLLDYEAIFNDAHELFEEGETAGIVRAISEIKVLDPAVGSGAFPMGMLHKMAMTLRRLDPDNQRWATLQKERARTKADAAFDTKDPRERKAELNEISDTFERYSGDFGRKLYLIQNSIFGVDIQPIATQIAKLRFFISLAIEQEPNKDADNFGIKPLPNLETRFIAADTLVQLKAADQLDLFRHQIEALKTKLTENRERHFHATTRRKKLACRDADNQLRRALAEELNAAGLPEDDANKITHWDPYDQNAKADWFDPEYMFGIADGFDIVIGNPPYIQLQKNRGELRRRYQTADFETFAATGDIYQLFYEKGCQLLQSTTGLLAYITSDSWLQTEYGKTTRRYFAQNHTPLILLQLGPDVFENAIVNTCILVVRSSKSTEMGKGINMDRLTDKAFPPDESLWGQIRPKRERPWNALSAIEQPIMDKMEAVGTPLKEWDVSIYRGVTTGLNDAFIIDDETKEELVAADPKSAEIIKPMLRGGKDIQRYQAEWAGLWFIDTHNGYDDVPAINIEDYPAIKNHLDRFYTQLKKRYDKGKTPYNLRNCAYHEDFEKEKLVWLDLTAKGRFVYDQDGMFCINTATMMIGQSLKYLCAVLNSNLIAWFMKNTVPTGMGGHPRWKKNTVETIPIPKISSAKQRPFIRLVNRILKAKADDPNADTGKLEGEIDRLVYQLYGLTEEEVEAV